jgi:hypothetical protein
VLETLARTDCKIPASFNPLDHPLLRQAFDAAVKSQAGEDLAKLKIWWTEDKATRRLTMNVVGPRDVMERCGWASLENLADKVDVGVTVVESSKEETF